MQAGHQRYWESALPPFYLSVVLFFVLLAMGLFVAHAIVDLKDLQAAGSASMSEVILWGLVPIPLMAANRAVARYMLFVLVPVCLYIAHISGKMYSERSTHALTVAFLISFRV